MAKLEVYWAVPVYCARCEEIMSYVGVEKKKAPEDKLYGICTECVEFYKGLDEEKKD
jgi:hypothetical protein